MSSPSNIGTHRELARRLNAGIEVVLSWHDRTGALTVSVSDDASGTYFAFEIDPSVALDAYQHPFAYAAFEGVPYDIELVANAGNVAVEQMLVAGRHV